MQMMFGSVRRKVSDDPVMRKVGKKTSWRKIKKHKSNTSKK